MLIRAAAAAGSEVVGRLFVWLAGWQCDVAGGYLAYLPIVIATCIYNA